jgi:hypothetical protein
LFGLYSVSVVVSGFVVGAHGIVKDALSGYLGWCGWYVVPVGMAWVFWLSSTVLLLLPWQLDSIFLVVVGCAVSRFLSLVAGCICWCCVFWKGHGGFRGGRKSSWSVMVGGAWLVLLLQFDYTR